MQSKKEKKGAGKPALKSRKDINRDGQMSRMAVLNQAAHAAGWKGISEYLTAVRKGQAVIPPKRA